MRKYILLLAFLIISCMSLAYAFDIVTFSQTQTHNYNGGLGQIRSSSELEVDSSVCGGSGTIYDNLYDLCWQKSPTTSTYNHANAISYCEGLSLAGRVNWKLPEKNELLTLLYHNGASTTYSKLNSLGFSNIQNNYYWSNTLYAPNPTSNAYIVLFNYGRPGYNSLTYSNYVLCVSRNS